MEWTRDTVKTEPPEAWLMHRHCPVFHIYRNKVPNWLHTLPTEAAAPCLQVYGSGSSAVAEARNGR
jgi:hypothetical protein